MFRIFEFRRGTRIIRLDTISEIELNSFHPTIKDEDGNPMYDESKLDEVIFTNHPGKPILDMNRTIYYWQVKTYVPPYHQDIYEFSNRYESKDDAIAGLIEIMGDLITNNEKPER